MLKTITRNDTADFTRAVEDGRPVLVKIAFDIGWGGLRDRFNHLAAARSGDLLEYRHWEGGIGRNRALEISVPDPEGVLQYHTLAEQYRRQGAMDLLWFSNNGTVQSAPRFVLPEDKVLDGRLFQEMIDHARATRHQGISDVVLPPRLIGIRISDPQIDKARRKPLKELYGRQAMASAPLERQTQIGLRLGSRINNRSILRMGRDFWVIGSPVMERRQANEILDALQGRDLPDPDMPAYIKVPISHRIQVIAAGKTAPIAVPA